MLNVIMLSGIVLSLSMLSLIMLSILKLNDVMLSVFMLIVIMVSVVAPVKVELFLQLPIQNLTRQFQPWKPFVFSLKTKRNETVFDLKPKREVENGKNVKLLRRFLQKTSAWPLKKRRDSYSDRYCWYVACLKCSISQSNCCAINCLR
jgi:hypothetical protein